MNIKSILSLLSIFILTTVVNISQAQITLVQDIFGTTSDYSSEIGKKVEYNGYLYFVARSEPSGWDLWRTDGTAGGTELFYNFEQYAGESDIRLTVCNNLLFFKTYFENQSNVLWRTDGTQLGTFPVVNNVSNNPYISDKIYCLNNEVYFLSNNAIWKSNGSPDNMTFVYNFDAINGDIYEPLVESNGALFFKADNNINGFELWKTDGTGSGTSMVKDINVGVNSSFPDEFCVHQGVLYFSANPSGLGVELWKSDGTNLGTQLVKDIYPGFNSSSPRFLKSINSHFYFTANDGTTGIELWKSDGTVGGTTLVTNLVSGLNSSNPANLTLFNSECYFTANYPTSSSSSVLFKTDGTVSGTIQLTTAATSLAHKEVYNGNLYFISQNAANGSEPYKTDGTLAGTVLLKDVFPGAVSSNCNNFKSFNSKLFFTGNNPLLNNELWVSNGTTAGTSLLKNICTGSYNNLSVKGASLNNNIIFSHQSQMNNEEVYISDGTALGTTLLKEIQPGTTGSLPEGFIRLGNKVIFSAYNSSGRELWVTDGTLAGTVLLKDIQVGAQGSDPSNFFFYNDEIYFAANTTSMGNELWKTNGTTAGTVLVKNIGSGSISSSPTKFIEYNGFLYFQVSNTSIYRTNGTTSGTTLVGNLDSYYSTIYNNELYLSAYNSITGANDLWKVNTSNNLILVKSFPLMTGGIYSNFSVVNNKLFFAAGDLTVGIELWSSDGTAAGTALFLDINTGIKGSLANQFHTINGRLLFTALTNSEGREIWESDGTILGTNLLKDIFPGKSSSNPSGFNLIGTTLYFKAYNGINGYELWETQGSNCNTHIVMDLNPSNLSSNPFFLASANSDVFFRSWQPNSGFELHKFENNDPYIEACDSFYWAQTGITYYQSGNYIDSLINVNGCDSLVSINLTIHHLYDSVNMTSCGSFTWPLSLMTYSNSGFYNFTEVNTAGCTINHTLNLTVYPVFRDTVTVNHCGSFYTWPISGSTYFNDGYYSKTLTSQVACDSIIVLRLNLGTTEFHTESISFCDSYTWSSNSQTYYFEGTYYDTLVAITGCDSINTLILSKDIIHHFPSLYVYSCQPYTWYLNNQTYTTDQFDSVTLVSVNGCDSVVYLDFNKQEIESYYGQVNTCTPYTWPVNGQTYFQGGYYSAILQTPEGCDSTVTFELNYTPDNNFFYDTVVACEPYTWPINGQTYNVYGYYNDTVLSTSGCDSIVYLFLDYQTLHGPDITVYACSAFDPYLYPANGLEYAVGSYNLITINNPTGCDSTHYLYVQYDFNFMENQVDTACNSYTWLSNSQTYFSSGIYYDTLISTNGCDSINVLFLHIYDFIDTIDVTSFSPYTWPANGVTYSTSGIYSFINTNSTGCDNIYYLNFNYLNPVDTIISAVQCEEYYWPDSTLSYYNSGTYINVLTNQFGQDSIVQLNLTLGVSIQINQTIISCASSFLWPINNLSYNTSGNYTYISEDPNGCDTMYLLDLTLSSSGQNITIVDQGNANIVASSADSYQWLNCISNSIIIGATNQNYIAPIDGEYAVIGTWIGGCETDTSECIIIDYLNLSMHNLFNINLYPNPTTGEVTITFSLNSSANVQVLDAQGKFIQESSIQSGDQISLENLERGVYFLNVEMEGKKTIRKIIRQ